jgi:uncharacterized membrane protein
MEKILNQYLEKIETYLKPMAASERIDIVKEIKSEILELQGNGVSSEQIIERLGNPKELAKAYLGESISRSTGFSLRKLSAVIAFYSLAGACGMFVLPITSICGITFMASGILCPIAGIIKFAGHLIGYEIPEITIIIGSYTASAFTVLPLSILIGAILFVVGTLFWKLTIIMIKSMIKSRKKLNDNESAMQE